MSQSPSDGSPNSDVRPYASPQLGAPISEPPGHRAMSTNDSLALLSEAMAIIATQTTRMSAALETIQEQNGRIEGRLSEIQENLRGFSDDGASLRTHLPDPFLVAYAAVAGAVVSVKTRKTARNRSISYILKSCAEMARQIVDEATAFREVSSSAGAVESALASLQLDPWGDDR